MKHANLAMVAQVARHFGDLREQVVFLGGAVTALLLTDPAAPEVRATKDVDVIVEVGSPGAYYQLETRLRELGFRNEPEVICRWSVEEILVDVMPTDTAILGFTNRWYAAAMKQACRIQIASESWIRLVTPEYFLATKLEAFEGRGRGDYLLSHDLEDIVTLLDGRPEIVAEVAAAEIGVRRYLQQKMREWLDNSRLLEALPGHLPPDEAGQQRYPWIVQRMHLLSEGKTS